MTAGKLTINKDASNSISLQASSSTTDNPTLILPAGDGTANQVLTTDGAGNLGWVDQSITVTSLSDAQATRMGLKEYLTGGTYNSVTIGVSGMTITHGALFPYQIQDGTWRMRFNITGSHPADSYTSVGITGVAYSYNQAIHASNGVGFATAITDSSGDVLFLEGTGFYTSVNISGDITLQAKPSWAY